MQLEDTHRSQGLIFKIAPPRVSWWRKRDARCACGSRRKTSASAAGRRPGIPGNNTGLLSVRREGRGSAQPAAGRLLFMGVVQMPLCRQLPLAQPGLFPGLLSDHQKMIMRSSLRGGSTEVDQPTSSGAADQTQRRRGDRRCSPAAETCTREVHQVSTLRRRSRSQPARRIH